MAPKPSRPGSRKKRPKFTIFVVSIFLGAIIVMAPFLLKQTGAFRSLASGGSSHDDDDLGIDETMISFPDDTRIVLRDTPVISNDASSSQGQEGSSQGREEGSQAELKPQEEKAEGKEEGSGTVNVSSDNASDARDKAEGEGSGVQTDSSGIQAGGDGAKVEEQEKGEEEQEEEAGGAHAASESESEGRSAESQVEETEHKSSNAGGEVKGVDSDSRGEDSDNPSDSAGTSSLSHHMDDEELLWRASFVPIRERQQLQQDGRPPAAKIAFLFLAEDGKLPLAQLWAKFFDGRQKEEFSVYVHWGVETGKREEDEELLPELFKGRSVPMNSAAIGEKGSGPGMSLVDAVRRVLANALLDLSNQHFILVPPTSIPLYNLTHISSYLSHSELSFLPNNDVEGAAGRGRYNAACFLPDLKLEQWRKGSLWFGLSRRLAVLAVADTKLHGKFDQCCKPRDASQGESSEPPACFPQEHYLATLMHVLASNELANWSLVYEDWWTDPSRGQPYVFGADETKPELLLFMRRCQFGSLCHMLGGHFSKEALPKLMAMPELGY